MIIQLLIFFKVESDRDSFILVISNMNINIIILFANNPVMSLIFMKPQLFIHCLSHSIEKH